MKKLVPLAIAATLLLGACGGGSSDGASPTTTKVTYTSSTATTAPETEYEVTDEEPPPFVLGGTERKFIRGYVMPNGRILWVDETSGIGRIIADPDEVLADQATCEYLFGMDRSDWFDWADDIPNFEGPVCHPYSVNEGS